jgi:UDP-N-acetylglucosamine 2-epimerase (non-hydrolysing)
MIEKMLNILGKEKPSTLVVYGDTNSALAGALAANRLGIDITHIEAGLRSFDIVMAEEVNRMIADHLSKFLFAPTIESKRNLLKEGIPGKKILVVGNTIVDAVKQSLEIARRSSQILKRLNLIKGGYFLITAHRPETVDFGDRLGKVIKGLRLVSEKFKLPLIFPMHPRTEKMVKEFGLKLPEGVKVIKPVSFFDFIELEANSRLVITDSGGAQEECCIIGIPCVTIRDNTERPETIKVRANILAGVEPDKILSCTKRMYSKKPNWINPFGDGTASKKILETLCSEIKQYEDH